MKRLVGDWMTTALLSAEADDPLYRAIELMAERGLRHVLVLRGEALEGIVSNRDLIRAAMRHPDRRLDLHECRVRDVMTRQPLHTTAPGASLGQAARLMSERRVSALPVLDRGKVVGILTTDDLLTALAAEDEPSGEARALRASDVRM